MPTVPARPVPDDSMTFPAVPPDSVWVLNMWCIPRQQDMEDDPWGTHGAFMGVYATSAAALEQLVEEIGETAYDARRWRQPGPHPWYWEWHPPIPAPAPGDCWYGLGAERIAATGGGLPDWLRPETEHDDAR